jgi:hypothetical protein
MADEGMTRSTLGTKPLYNPRPPSFLQTKKNGLRQIKKHPLVPSDTTKADQPHILLSHLSFTAPWLPYTICKTRWF